MDRGTVGRADERRRAAGLSTCCPDAARAPSPSRGGVRARLAPAPQVDWVPARTPPGRPRAAPRPEPPPLAASPRSAFTALGRGPPLGSFRFRFPAAVVEENESDRGRGPGRRSCRRGEGRTKRRRSARSLGAGAPTRARRDGSTPWTCLHRKRP